MRKIFIFLFLLFFWGCSYHFSLDKIKKEPRAIKITKIYIEPFINRTPERKLENLLINKLVYECNTGEIEVVRKERAEAFLTGEFTAYEATGIAFTKGEYTATGRVRIAVKVRLTDKKKNRLWEERELSDQEEFQITTNPSQTQDNREKAISRIMQRIAEQIYEELTVAVF